MNKVLIILYIPKFSVFLYNIKLDFMMSVPYYFGNMFYRNHIEIIWVENVTN